MKLIFRGHDYQYAVEQMLFSLFPGEKPVYEGDAEDEMTLSLTSGRTWLTATAVLTWQGGCYRGSSRAKLATLTGETLADDRICQRILKQAFYTAATSAIGREPAWGAVTGVRPVKIPTKAMEAGLSPKQAEHILRDTYHISPSRRKLAMDCAKASLTAKKDLAPDEISLYVGIPFCPTRCAYCSFVSADVGRTLRLVEPFLEVLRGEIVESGLALKELGQKVRTLYIGGGTPTTLNAGQLDSLLTTLKAEIDLSHCTEITVEAGRPDTITLDKLQVLCDHGVDRISVNPQSMDDKVLQSMGRAHTASDILRAWEMVKKVGFPCTNMDLIAGLPMDSVAGFQSSLNQVLDMNPENITVHTLALKKGSKLTLEGGNLVSGADVSAMLDYGWQTLGEKGFIPYYLYRQKYMSGSFENVGWAKPGFENLYNLCMMEELHTVVALGGGGITKLVDSKKGQIVRINNPKYPHEYLKSKDKFTARWEKYRAFIKEVTP